MAMIIKRKFHEADAVASWGNIEVIADGAVVVNGILLDLRGARTGATLILDEPRTEEETKQVVLNRDSDGNWMCIISERHTSTSSESESTVSTYPHVVSGTGSQTITETRGITKADALKETYRNLYKQLDGWSEGLNALGKYYPQSIVNAGHDWLLLGGYEAAYMIANSSSYTWNQKVSWAEQAGRGALDITSPAEFYANPETHTAPTQHKTWVNPSTGLRVELTDSVVLTETAPDTGTVVGGGWIESL